MPSHNHSAGADTQGSHTHSIRAANGLGAGTGLIIGTYNADNTAVAYYSGNHSHVINIGNTGNNQFHNNMPPYRIVMCWRRIS